MSLIHSIRSPGFRSMKSVMSIASLVINPQWLCTVPLGLPVVPEVNISIMGASAGICVVGAASERPAHKASHQWSVAGFHRTGLSEFLSTTT